MVSNIHSAPAYTVENSRSASNDIAAAFESSLQKQQSPTANDAMDSQNRFWGSRFNTHSSNSVWRKEIGQGIAIGATVVGILGFIGGLASMPAWMPGDEGGRKKNSY